MEKVEDSLNSGHLPKNIYDLILRRYEIVTKGIKRIENAARLKYPYYYIDPNLIISTSQVESSQFGVFFARTIPVVSDNRRLNVVIQITAPLIAFGLLGTIHAILAHEFMHYLNLVSRIMRMGILSDSISGTLFEERYEDSSRLTEARSVFKTDRTLVDHITKKFPDGFSDMRLEGKVVNEWMNKGLPTIKVTIDSNIIKLPIELMANLEVDEQVKKRIMEIENKKQ
ncbi:MAG TPA: hypothetical protein VFY64_02130 [Nitrososphaeraceae archaeon]|nr:hypothetical protein [Nitrososphaeraceae archaeon]